MVDKNILPPVLIAGGGIGGLAVALTLHQVGVPCIVFEAVAELQPLGVGINLQPNAVRELHELGFDDALLDTVGIQAREWALVGRNGNDVYSEPRGRLPATAGRSIRCTAACCRCCCCRRCASGSGPTPCAWADASPATGRTTAA